MNSSREELEKFVSDQYLSADSSKFFMSRISAMFDGVDRNNKMSKVSGSDAILISDADIKNFKSDVAFASNFDLISAFHSYIGSSVNLIKDSKFRKKMLIRIVSIDLSVKLDESKFSEVTKELEFIAEEMNLYMSYEKDIQMRKEKISYEKYKERISGKDV